ncbi:MAG: IS630 family transposase [Deltaproteobacteria bacterium]|nr:IS630 family transposase [Deltaproteobacteria bacterium]
MARSQPGQAIRRARRRGAQLKQLDEFILEAQLKNDLGEWRRARAVRAYIGGRKVTAIAADYGVTRGSVNRWLQWYDADHVDGLRTRIAEGPAPKLTDEQREALAVIISLGPMQAGYQSGVWTGPMIGDLIEERFGVRYHNHHVPRLLHQLKFSVQRPRKRLARADLARQATWLRETFPRIKKKRANAVASLPSATKPASGSTERSIKRGHQLAASPA